MSISLSVIVTLRVALPLDSKMKWSCLILLITFLAACQGESRLPNRIGSIDFTRDSAALVQTFKDMEAAPHLADSLAMKARVQSESSAQLQDVFLFQLARFYIQMGKLREADSVINFVFKENEPDKTNKTLGKYHNLKAAISAFRDQHEQSVYHYQKAIEIFEGEGEVQMLPVIQFNLANIFFSRLDYNSAYKYSKAAKENFEAQRDSLYAPIAQGIYAIAAVKLDRLEEGQTSAQKALEESMRRKNTTGTILAKYALGELSSADHNYQDARIHFEQALELAENTAALNLLLPIKAALLATYLHLDRNEEAIDIGKQSLEDAAKVNNADILYSLHRNIAYAYANIRQNDLAFEHLKQAEDLFRKNTVENNEKTLQTLLLHYETEKKERQLAESQLQIQRQNVRIRNWLIVGIILIGGFLAIFIQQRRNQQAKFKILEKEKENELLSARVLGEEIERGRISKELHDGVASALLVVRLQLEKNTKDAQQNAVQLIKKTHKELRSIAHKLNPINFAEKNWMEEVRSFAENIRTESREVHFYSEIDALPAPATHQLVLFRAVQELLQNVVKHAQASNVAVQIGLNGHQLHISIEDDGVGTTQEIVEKASSLSSLRSRLQDIDALLHLETAPNQGTAAFITYTIIPTSSAEHSSRVQAAI